MPKRQRPALQSELSLFADEDFDSAPSLVAGVDEAGRGPLAGPVCAAAVILDPARPIEGLNDSKKLSAKQRDALEPLIKERALAWCVAWGSVEEIDEINILQSTMATMRRAVEGLSTKPDSLIIDGTKVPQGLTMPAVAQPKADGTYEAVAAASILAKTARDRLLTEYETLYPGYGFAQHAGYGTALHLEAIERLGVTPVHRKTFNPIKTMIEEGRVKFNEPTKATKAKNP